MKLRDKNANTVPNNATSNMNVAYLALSLSLSTWQQLSSLLCSLPYL